MLKISAVIAVLLLNISFLKASDERGGNIYGHGLRRCADYILDYKESVKKLDYMAWVGGFISYENSGRFQFYSSLSDLKKKQCGSSKQIQEKMEDIMSDVLAICMKDPALIINSAAEKYVRTYQPRCEINPFQ
jgi:hypothetical protein